VNNTEAAGCVLPEDHGGALPTLTPDKNAVIAEVGPGTQVSDFD
jgi:hypothetical protein